MRIRPIDRNRIADTIRRQLLDMINEQYAEGVYKLPTEQQIANQLNVSRNTLRPVLSQMASEGIILRKHGMGTFINPEALAICVNLQEMIDFSSIIERCGHTPSHEIYSLTESEAGKAIAEKLRIEPDDKVLRVEYWLYADGIPAIVVEGWCGRNLFIEKPEKELWENDFVFKILDRYAGLIKLEVYGMRIQPKNRTRLVDASIGRIPCDLVIRNARVVNVFTGEIYEGNVGISEGFIAHVQCDPDKTGRAEAPLVGEKEYDAKGAYLTPGFIDSHIHIESTMMTPRYFAKAVIPHGTTTVITDPHEIGNVFGVKGVQYMHECSEDLPMRHLILAPSCVPSLPGKENGGAVFRN